MEKAVSHRKKGVGQSFLGAVLFSLFLTLLFLIALLLIASFLSLRVKDPAALIPLWGNGASLLGALFCGFVAARLRGRQGLLVGGAAGVADLLLFLLGLAALAGGRELQIGRILFSYLIFLSLSILGGLLGTMKQEKRPRRKKTYR